MNPQKSIDRLYYTIALNELRLMNRSEVVKNISYNSLLYLDLISFSQDCTVSYLASVLHVAKSSVTIKVNELVKQGLIEKRQSETDRRVFYLSLTEAAAKDFYKLDLATAYAVEQIQSEYPASKIAELCKILDAFSLYYEQYAEQGREDNNGTRNS